VFDVPVWFPLCFVRACLKSKDKSPLYSLVIFSSDTCVLSGSLFCFCLVNVAVVWAQNVLRPRPERVPCHGAKLSFDLFFHSVL
jgi:hypothetical protein